MWHRSTPARRSVAEFSARLCLWSREQKPKSFLAPDDQDSALRRVPERTTGPQGASPEPGRMIGRGGAPAPIRSRDAKAATARRPDKGQPRRRSMETSKMDVFPRHSRFLQLLLGLRLLSEAGAFLLWHPRCSIDRRRQ